jgi:LAS superfamily LD-carboxypeptidase LdcB
MSEKRRSEGERSKQAKVGKERKDRLARVVQADNEDVIILWSKEIFPESAEQRELTRREERNDESGG